jgi:TRAP-type C4-dicarboxylate transport system substrate-binding protein
LLAAGKKAEAYFNKATKALDDKMVDIFKKNNVEVITLTPDEYNAWVEVAKQSSYAEFAKDVPDGKALIDQALAVK